MEEDNFIKITNVVYKVLDHLPDSDPLKNRAKEKVLAILENLTLLSQAPGWVSLQKEKASAELLDDIEVLKNYLNVGRHQGWIDSINFLIITKEYDHIKSSIKPPKGVIRQGFEIANRINLEPKINIEKRKKSADQKEKNTQSLSKEEYSGRQAKILSILDKREKAQVSDFIKELKDVTKRTIRRDLDDLLKRGKVVRAGEWNQVVYRKKHEVV